MKDARRSRLSRRVAVACAAIAAVALAASAAAVDSGKPSQASVADRTVLSEASRAPVASDASPAPQANATVSTESTTADPKAAGVPAVATTLTGDNAIPATVLAAYRKAASTLAVEKTSCHLTWPLLAGIGKVETDHGRSWGPRARITAKGEVVPTILGPVLDGRDSTAKLLDTDGGAYDHNRTYDRAVGPLQFVPSTWREFGRDGNGDGTADPNNIWDASLGAASYLCANNRDLAKPADRRAAILAYNPSSAYVRSVLAWAAAYQHAAISVPALGSVPDPVVLGAGGEDGQGAFGDTDDSASYEAAGYGPDDSGDPAHVFRPQPAVTLAPSTAPATRPTPAVTPKPIPKPAATPVCVAPGVTLVKKVPVNAAPVDNNRDGKHDALRVTAEVTAVKPGPYTFEVQLLDADRYGVTGALHTLHLVAGKQLVTDYLSGRDIGDAGASGPATLQITVRQAAALTKCAVVLTAKASAGSLDPTAYEGWTVDLARLQQRLAADIKAGLVKGVAAKTLLAALQTPSAAAPNLQAFLAELGSVKTIDPMEQTRLASLAQRLIDQNAPISSPAPTSSPTPTPTLTPSPLPSPTLSPSASPSPTRGPYLTGHPTPTS